MQGKQAECKRSSPSPSPFVPVMIATGLSKDILNQQPLSLCVFIISLPNNFP